MKRSLCGGCSDAGLSGHPVGPRTLRSGRLWQHFGDGNRSSGAAVNGAKVTVTSQPRTSRRRHDQRERQLFGHALDSRCLHGANRRNGIQGYEFRDIQVSADTGSRVDGQFQVGSTSEQVEVTAEAPQLKTDRADVSIEFNAQAVEDLRC